MAAHTAVELPEITAATAAPLAQSTDSLSIDPTAAEALLSAVQIGQRIKRLRLKRSMGLVELGRLTGLSASFLSQLETGRVVPTLRNLARIALVFNKDLSWFFESSGHSVFRIQRRRERVQPADQADRDCGEQERNDFGDATQPLLAHPTGETIRIAQRDGRQRKIHKQGNQRKHQADRIDENE